jgi:PilZ domain-containing protein
MVETRSAPRYRVIKAAKIKFGGTIVLCTVRDLSATGAALEISNPDEIPSEFNLVVPEDRLNLPCRVVWRRAFRIGVAFD